MTGACGAPLSQRLRDTTGQTSQIAKQSGGLTIFWGDPKTAKAIVSPTFHTHSGKDYEILDRQPADIILIDFQMGVHTYLSVC